MTEENNSLEQKINSNDTLKATAICLTGGAIAGLICKYVDANIENHLALKTTWSALIFGAGAGATYLGLTKERLNKKIESLKNHAINYSSLMAGLFGSYFL